MKRRDFFTAMAADSPPQDPSLPPSSVGPSPYANRVIPSLQRTTAGLEPYTGAFGTEQLLHLLRRTMFGASRADVAALQAKTMFQVVDQLLAVPDPESSVPLIYATATTEPTPIGSTWITATTNDNSGARTTSLRAWWLSLMLNQSISIREKMVLFWHNHFVTAASTVGDPRFAYRYVALLRKHALGNIKDLTRAITIDGAMLRYLNGNRNTRTAPDENYGRELQELFTIGKGPQIGEGDYSNYTEDDVKAASKVLTGWRDFRNTDGSVGETTWSFDIARHDTGNKQFSYHYNNTLIVGGADGLLELNTLLDMIFAQPETARHLCRKLYRWFVYYVIDSWTETNIIDPLATTLRANNYNVLPVLEQLLRSAHFYDPLNIGCIIKSPLDHAVGTCREFHVQFPASDPAVQYPHWNYLVTRASLNQQNLGDPPDVSGWHAYYQEPQFYELWINSDTLPRRSAWTTTMISSGYSTGGFRIRIDPMAFVQTMSDPGDPNAIVNDAVKFLFAIPVTESQRAFLKNVLLPGLPDYEWTIEWSTYLADPTNTQKLNAVRSKLQALLTFMMQMPEYQLM